MSKHRNQNDKQERERERDRRVQQDFLELPSMALEKFASEPSLLRRVSSHFKSSDSPDAPTLPQETIDRIKLLDKFMVGASQSRYFAMALFDLVLHSRPPPYEHEGRSGLSIEERAYVCTSS